MRKVAEGKRFFFVKRERERERERERKREEEEEAEEEEEERKWEICRLACPIDCWSRKIKFQVYCSPSEQPSILVGHSISETLGLAQWFCRTLLGSPLSGFDERRTYTPSLYDQVLQTRNVTTSTMMHRIDVHGAKKHFKNMSMLVRGPGTVAKVSL